MFFWGSVGSLLPFLKLGHPPKVLASLCVHLHSHLAAAIPEQALHWWCTNPAAEYTLGDSQSPEILQYKTSIIESCKFVTEYNRLSNECVDLAGYYTEPLIIQKSKEQTEKICRQHVRSVHTSGSKPPSQLLSNHKNQSIRIDQLFSPDSDGNTQKTVILSGDSGRGKSFMLQKIMLDWASGVLYSEKFDVVFLLKSEELKCISEEMSLFQLLSRSCSLAMEQISQILDLTPEKVLFLIDGTDEYVSHPPLHLMLLHTNPFKRAPPMVILRNLLRGILLPESFLLVTTRSHADAVMNLLKGPQRFTEIMGFSERGVQEYFQKFFQDEQLFRKMYERVKINESLLTACSVPLQCWMICFCLKKHLTGDDCVMRELKTNTSIYVHFVSTLLEQHDQSQSVLTMLRSLGQLAERGIQNQQVFFDEKPVAETGLDASICLFLYKGSLKRKEKQVSVFKFIHFSFQEIFAALYYVLLDEKEHSLKVSELFNLMEWEAIIDKPSPDLRERRSIPIPPVILFLYGLLNEEVSSSFLENIEWTVPHTIKLKKKEMRKTLKRAVALMIQRYGIELFALHCLHELQDKRFVRKIFKVYKSMDLCNVSLKSTDCWVLLYCLQCCPNIRDLYLMYCDLTAEKLKILQPAFCMCENLRLTVDYLYDVGELIQILGESKILRKLKVQEDEYSAESLIWSLDLSVTHEDVLLSLSSSEKNPSFPGVLNITLTCPQSEISSTDWSLFLQRLSKTEKVAEDSSALDEHVSLLLSSFHSVGLKTLELKLVVLNESWLSGIISLVQTCTSLQQLSVSVTGLLLEEGLMLLKKSLTEPHCTVLIEGRKCSKLTDQCKEQDWSHSCNEKVEIHFKPNILKELEELNNSEPSGLNLQPLPVCQSCVHIVDSDQWVQVEPSVCTDEGGSEFRISTPAGRFECSRTRMRWVCAGDITLQYRAVDGGFLSEELERLQCERIGPVIDVTVISGKLEEAHLPHYTCLAESDPSLTQSVKVLNIEDEGISLESVELTRFHAKVLQPSFSPKTVLMKLGIAVKVHCDLFIFMTHKDPIILHVYFLPVDSLFEEKIKIVEKSSHQISLSRPETPLQMNKQHSLDVPGASVQPKAIKLRGDIKPNFFEVINPVDDIDMTLSRVDDQKSVWTSKIYKALFGSMLLNSEFNLFPKVAVNFDKVNFFDRNWHTFIKSVKNVNNIADNLLQKQIIHEELYSEITHPTSTSEASMRKICSIVRKGSDTVKEMFICILLEEDPNLLNHLPLPDS
ncbi:NACHT, LRR and PYD domains-containing protein 1 homolog [Carassius carassius]|uniref:NACHT, LRR and PYD domains-containing protein 1 homolog n=1 Tax=Carassius carassius TaxID=217509 RepID=UPI0028685D66|nr:NACHT, LRR and PYD domains-containing protein 1 homolog [Carassius carassius]